MSTEQEIKVEDVPVEEAAPEEQLLQAGDLLREKRELLGLSQKDIADRLRLRLAIIKSIDENNYDFDQVATFTRGYLRSYAKAVSLDEKAVFDAFNYVDTKKPVEEQMQSFSRKVKREKHDSYVMKITWVIALVILGISSLWWYQSQQDTLTEASAEASMVNQTINSIETEARTGEPVSPITAADRAAALDDSTATESDAQPEAVSTDTSSEAAPAEQSKAEPASATNAEPVSVSTDPVVEATPVAESEIVIIEENGAPLENTENALSMSFVADCWIQVKDAGGKTLATGVQKAGKTIQLSGQTPYQVILGAPKGVSMIFAGESVDLSGYNSGKVARFSLP